MIRIVSFGWTLTAVFFLVSLAFIYANLGEVVNLDGSTASISDYSVSRDVFFYSLLITFLLINIIFRGLGYLLAKVPVTSLQRKTFFNSESFKTQIVVWVISFSAVVNIAIILSMLIIGFANYAENPRSTAIGLFAYVGYGLVIAWLLWLIVIFLRRKSA